jgi:hypothetical protein
VPDLKANGFQISPHLMIPKAQGLDALRRQETFPLSVVFSLLGKSVSAAIEFDGDAGLYTEEVQEVDAARVLATKLEIVEAPVAQQTPEASFGVSGFLAQLAGEVACFGASRATSTPHPDPLPSEGRGKRLGRLLRHRIQFNTSLFLGAKQMERRRGRTLTFQSGISEGGFPPA